MIGASGRRSAPRSSFSRGITEMEEAEDLEKTWLVDSRGVGGVPAYVGVAYGDSYNRKLCSLTPDHNYDDVHLIGLQTSDQPERRS